jgi:hypothetical protein
VSYALIAFLYAIGAAISQHHWLRWRRSLTCIPEWDWDDWFMMGFFIPLTWPLAMLARGKPRSRP